MSVSVRIPTILRTYTDGQSSVDIDPEVMTLQGALDALEATAPGILRLVTVAPGETVFEGHPLAFIEERDDLGAGEVKRQEIDLDLIRPDLAEVLARQARARDEARPKAVERRRKTGQRTARENLADLVDPGTFVEYGALTVAAQFFDPKHY